MVLQAKLGVAVEDGRSIYLRFDERPGTGGEMGSGGRHTGIVGTTGAGKTVLLTTIMREVLSASGAAKRNSVDVWYCAYPPVYETAYFTPEMLAAANMKTLDIDTLDVRLKTELAERNTFLGEHTPPTDYVFEGSKEDLDNLSERELVELLDQAGAAWSKIWTIADYRDDPRFDTDQVPSTLVIVVDDLTRAINDRPDFLNTLTNAMRGGRQLDVHLCWAAQRWPRGAGLITALTGNQIALRTHTLDDVSNGIATRASAVDPTNFRRPGEAVWNLTHFIVTPPSG